MQQKRKKTFYTAGASLIGTIPNIVAAVLTIIYFRYFFILDTTSLLQTEMNRSIKFSIIITLFIFLLFVSISYYHNRRQRKMITKLHEKKLNANELNLLKRYILNIPFRQTMISLTAWLFAALSVSIFLNMNGMTYRLTISMFLIILFIGGSFASVLSFYMSDVHSRNIIKDLFPDGGLKNIPGAVYIRFYVRLIISFWIGGILPVMLSNFYSSNFNDYVRTYGFNEELAMKNYILSIFVILLSVFFTLATSRYFFKHYGKPLIELEQKMAEVEEGNLSSSLTVTQNDEIGSVFDGFNHMTRGLKDREKIKDLFGKFVSEDIRDAILSGGVELGGNRRTASILFSDIRNFTTLSEKLSSKEVVDLLNSYFNEMVKPVFHYQGVLDKFIGDAIMAVFGTPKDDPQHPDHAVQCALLMLQKLKAFNELQLVINREPINIGIGINTGEVTAGNIGASQRMEYTVIGDAVNTASRLESLTKNYNVPIIIAESTYAALSGELKKGFKALESVLVKGKTQPVNIYGYIEA